MNIEIEVNKFSFKNVKGIFAILFKNMKSIFVYKIIYCLLTATKPFVPIYFSARILDELLGVMSINRLTLYVSLLIGLTFIFHIIAEYLLKRLFVIYGDVYYTFKKIKSEKRIYMDYEYITDPKTQKLIHAIHETEGMTGGTNGLMTMMRNGLSAFFEIIIAGIIMVDLFNTGERIISNLDYSFLNSPYLLAVFIVILLISIVLYSFLGNKRIKFNGEFIKIFMPINRVLYYIIGHIGFDYKNGKDIRLYNSQNFFIDSLEEQLNGPVRKFEIDYTKAETKYAILLSIINSISIGFIYLYVTLQAFIGLLTIGAVLMQVNTITRFYRAIATFIRSYNLFKVTINYMSYILDFLNLKPIKYQGTLPIEKRSDNKYTIEFENVTFKYPGTKENAVKNINLSLKIGERLAIVGMNGAGKTTLIKLLCRLYDPNEGTITLNGIDIKKYDYNEYMQMFSVVFQDFHTFGFQIEQNIAGSTIIDEKKLKDSLKKAGIFERIDALKNKSKTYVEKAFDKEGVELSGGEKQKLAIARALYKDAPIVILDEPTASLDPISEYEIYSKFNTLIENKTSIYISHRLASCRFCHNIIVFHEGEIIQSGDHDKLLLDKQGKYYELWNAQAQYYK